jgi:O-antigen/teichoic acid export membrane protein
MAWTLAGALIARGLGLIASVVAARWLGREGFGELGVIQSTVAMFGAFAGFGLGLTATKHIAEWRSSDPARAGRVIGFSGVVAAISGTVMALGVVLTAGPLAEHALAAPGLRDLLQVSAGLVFLGALNGAQLGALSGLEAFKTIARVNLWSGLASFPILIAGVWWGGLNGAVWGLVASAAVNWLFHHLALRIEARRVGVPLSFRPRVNEWKREGRMLWQFSLPAMLCGFMVLPVHWIGAALLAHQPHGYAELGLFNAANQWRVAILFVPQAIAGIVLPALAGLHGQREHGRYLKVFWSNVALIGGVALALALGVALCSGFIIRNYGAEFAGGRGVLVLLALSAVVLSVNQVLGVDLISRGKMWQVLGCNAAWAAALLGVACWLVPAHGAFGLALALLVSYPVQSVFMLALNLNSAPASSCIAENRHEGPVLPQ